MKATLLLCAALILLMIVGNLIARRVFDPTWLEYMTLVGKIGPARVEMKDAENQQAIDYAYEVNGVAYNGSGATGDLNPEFEKIAVGDVINIYYDSSDPQQSITSNPWNLFEAQRARIYGFTAVFPIFPMIFLLIVVLGRKQKRKPPFLRQNL